MDQNYIDNIKLLIKVKNNAIFKRTILIWSIIGIIGVLLIVSSFLCFAFVVDKNTNKISFVTLISFGIIIWFLTFIFFAIKSTDFRKINLFFEQKLTEQLSLRKCYVFSIISMFFPFFGFLVQKYSSHFYSNNGFVKTEINNYYDELAKEYKRLLVESEKEEQKMKEEALQRQEKINQSLDIQTQRMIDKFKPSNNEDCLPEDFYTSVIDEKEKITSIDEIKLVPLDKSDDNNSLTTNIDIDVNELNTDEDTARIELFKGKQLLSQALEVFIKASNPFDKRESLSTLNKCYAIVTLYNYYLNRNLLGINREDFLRTILDVKTIIDQIGDAIEALPDIISNYKGTTQNWVSGGVGLLFGGIIGALVSAGASEYFRSENNSKVASACSRICKYINERIDILQDVFDKLDQALNYEFTKLLKDSCNNELFKEINSNISGYTTSRIKMFK